MSVAIYPDSDTLSHEAARYVVRVASEAITTHGRFTLALAGGSTPKKLYALLASEPYRDQIDWTRSEIFWSDERCVPPDSEDSNYHLALETLLSKVPLSASQIHRMPADAENRDEAALAYTQEIQRVFDTNGIPSFDLLQLGMGPEAHTASLFPHQASLHEQTRLIIPVTVPKPPPPRLTFTPPLLNAAAHILFLVTGQDKAAALQEVLEGEYNPDEYPSQIIRPTKGEVTWMLDPAAASKLHTQHV
jgi:6-phosphogluconolactonase